MKLVSHFFSLRALIVGFMIGAVAVGAGMAIASGVGGGSATSPRGSASGGSQPASTSSCQLPDQLAQAVAAGEITQEQACVTAKELGAAAAARQTAGNPTGPGENNLEIDGAVQDAAVEKCRAGDPISEEGPQADALYCNAILKIAAGQLKPTSTQPDGTPVWSYSQAQLEQLPK